MDARAQAGNQFAAEELPGVSRSQLLDLFDEVEDLLKRVADTENTFVRHGRARVLAKLIAIKKHLLVR
jgi:hypothetical protein